MLKKSQRAKISELVGICGISGNAIRSHVQRAKLRPDKDKRYVVSDVLEAIVRHREQANNKKSSDGEVSWSDKKRQKECELLDLKIAQTKGESISIPEKNKILMKHLTIVKSGLENLRRSLKAITTDQALIKAQGDMIDATLNELARACEAEGI